MPSRRGAITMTDQERAQFLAEGHTLQVASNGIGGFPHLVAMWYTVDRGDVVFTTFRKSQKILNLQRNPKLSVMLEDGSTYAELRGLVIEGTAEIVDELAETERVMQIVGAKYGSLPSSSEGAEARRKVASKRVVVRLHEEKSYTWDHRKLGGVY
jgi:PPOX class probable F420-dependent enzyme